MQVLACVLVTVALAVNGQNDANSTDSSDNGSDSNSSNRTVATSVVVSLVLMIVVALTITMWVCACCRPEKAFKKSTRQTRKWHWRSNMRQAAPDRLPMVGVMEANDKRKSLDISRMNSMDLGDSQLWRSNENMTMDGSCDDLYASQNYVNSMNYSENENDFQMLNLDEALFENPSSRSRSEAQLSTVVFSNTTGLQAKAKKLDDLSNEKILEFYDLQTPKNSPRRKNKVSCSTGDLASEPSPSLSAKNVRPTTKQMESPLVNQQQEEILTVSTEQTDSTVENIERTDGRVDNEQVNSESQLQSVDTCTTGDQMEPVTSSPQEDNVSCISKDSLREISTGTPDSGVVMNEDLSNNKSQGGQSVKPDHTSDGSVVMDSKSDTLSVHSGSTDHTVTIHDTDSVANGEPAVVTMNPVANDTGIWETVADRKKRYLQTVEHSKVVRKSPTGDDQPTNMVSCSFTQVEADSDYGNSDDEEESTPMLFSSQPMLNLTGLEESKTSLREDSSSDSDTEEMQSPLVSTKLSPRDHTTMISYTNPLLSDHDSSDEDCEMVQPSEVVVYRSPVKNGGQDVQHHRASHPPLQRTLNHEQIITSIVQRTKKLQHKPSLKSIMEEDYNNTQHTHTF